MADNAVECETCSKSFRCQRYLLQHIKRNHQAVMFHCHYCSYQCKGKSNLARHISRVHISTPKRVPVPVKCPMCVFKCAVRKEMIQHYTTDHGIDIEEQHLEFQNENQFSQWKEAIERMEVCHFSAPSGRHSRCSRVICFYRCSRDGIFRSKGCGRRQLKVKGSNKMGGICPASMKVVVDEATGAVNVTFTRTHVGHDKDLSRMTLSKSERAEIAGKLAQGVPLDDVLHSLRGSATNDDFQRLHLITRKDLHNVQASFGLKQAGKRPKHENCISVEAWLKMTQQYPDVVRFHKPKGTLLPEEPELLEDDMVLIVATAAQIEMLEAFGPTLVCFDGIHRQDAYNLTTILVANEMKQGIPCAYMFSNRTDCPIMTLFSTVLFSLVRKPILANVFMSDMSETYMKGWSSVMPRPNHLLFCTWHVDRAWKTNLNKISSPEKKAKVYQTVKILMLETDERTFEQSLVNSVKQLESDVETREFGVYFRDVFSRNARSWACAYRRGLGVDTSMYLENIHKVLEYVYSPGRKFRKLDKAIPALLRLARDKADPLKVEEQGKLASAVRRLHETSVKMESSVVAFGGGWLVTSGSVESTCVVQKTEVQSCKCAIQCVECGICVHNYVCDCVDAVIRSNMCKHVHFLARFLANPESTDDDDDDDTSVCELGNRPEDIVIIEVSEDDEAGDDLNEKKRKLREKFEELMSKVECDDDVDVLRNALHSVESTISPRQSTRRGIKKKRNP